MSLAKIREQLRRPRIQEADRVEGEDEKGFTFSFDPSGRRKYENIMKVVGYVEDPAFAETNPSTSYMCGSCEYMLTNISSSTGYSCKKYLFDDRPFGCCGGYSKKEG